VGDDRHTADAGGDDLTMRLRTDMALGIEGDWVRARHTLEEDVAVREEAVHEGPDQLVLSDDPMPDLAQELIDEGALRFDPSADLLDIDRHGVPTKESLGWTLPPSSRWTIGQALGLQRRSARVGRLPAWSRKPSHPLEMRRAACLRGKNQLLL
jgi:hypothetical protein